jgi:hypothetical protein
MHSNREAARLQEARAANIPWTKWGLYLSARQWGTVRERITGVRMGWLKSAKRARRLGGTAMRMRTDVRSLTD